MPDTRWEAGLLRAVLFTQQALPITTDIFSSLTGQDPERQEDRPKEGVRVQVGKVDDLELRITISPVTVDIVVSNKRVPPQELIGGAPLTFGELKAELAKFERRLQTWIPKWQGTTTRVALLVTARVPVTDRVEAYKILQYNLKNVKVQPEKMRDFIYRVNFRANTSALPENFYNRSSTWTAIQFDAAASAGLGKPDIPLSRQYYAQLEMDINTPAERTEPLPRDKIGTIYREFFQLAAEMADSGEPS